MNINEVIINNRVSRYFVGTLTNLQFYMKLRAFVRSVVKSFCNQTFDFMEASEYDEFYSSRRKEITCKNITFEFMLLKSYG